MARNRAIISALGGAALLALVAGCGAKADLKPPVGEAPPPIPVGAKKQPTTEELTTPDAQARPERSDELLKRSEQRSVDDFDLPPPG